MTITNEQIANLKDFLAVAISVFWLIGFTGTANADIIQIDENLNDNLVPTGFSLSTTNAAGLANGRLEASAINGSALLQYNNLPGNLSQLDISFRGHFGYSFWGTYTQVEMTGLPTLFHGVADFNFGQVNRASIGGVVSTTPFNFSEFVYSINIIDGQINYSGTDTATDTLAFNLSYVDAGILLSDITQIGFRSHNTTGTEPVWLDDIEIQLHTVDVPAPATLFLFCFGLAGLGYLKRSRIG